jgi:hypothetical protein
VHAGKEEVQWPDYYELLATELEKQAPPPQHGQGEERKLLEAASGPGQVGTASGNDEGDTKVSTAAGHQDPTSGGLEPPTGMFLLTPAKTVAKTESNVCRDNTCDMLSRPAGPGSVTTILPGAKAAKKKVTAVADRRRAGDFTGLQKPITEVQPPAGASDVGFRLNPTPPCSGKSNEQANQSDLTPSSPGKGGELGGNPYSLHSPSPPSRILSQDPVYGQPSKALDVPAGSLDAHDASSVQATPTGQEVAVERGTSGPDGTISPDKARDASPAHTAPTVEGKAGSHGIQPSPSGADAGIGSAADDAGVGNSLAPPMGDEESKKDMAAGSSMVPPQDFLTVERQTKTDSEVPHTSIRDQWDVEEAEVLLVHYIKHAELQKQKPGAL